MKVVFSILIMILAVGCASSPQKLYKADQAQAMHAASLKKARAPLFHNTNLNVYAPNFYRYTGKENGIRLVDLDWNLPEFYWWQRVKFTSNVPATHELVKKQKQQWGYGFVKDYESSKRWYFNELGFADPYDMNSFRLNLNYAQKLMDAGFTVTVTLDLVTHVVVNVFQKGSDRIPDYADKYYIYRGDVPKGSILASGMYGEIGRDQRDVFFSIDLCIDWNAQTMRYPGAKQPGRL